MSITLKTNMKKRALFIGRFQPFHKGHLSVIEQIAKAPDIDEIIIGIGSPQIDHTFSNPFTASERGTMIRASLYGMKKVYQIVLISDIHDNEKWAAHVESLIPDFKVVYVGNTLVRRLFTEKGYEVRNIDPVHKISATDIRERIIRKVPWRKYLPPGSLEVIEKIKGAKRIRNLYFKHVYPAVTVDIIIEHGAGLILIKRRDGKMFGGWWALPGGFLETGKESVEQAVIREAREETSLQIDLPNLKLFGIYSDPQRDPRQPTVAVVFQTLLAEGEPKAGDDAQSLKVFPWNQVPKQLAFDHATIIEDYRKKTGIL